MAKMRRLQKISPIMQKFLHEAAKTTFCSLKSPVSDVKVLINQKLLLQESSQIDASQCVLNKEEKTKTQAMC